MECQIHAGIAATGVLAQISTYRWAGQEVITRPWEGYYCIGRRVSASNANIHVRSELTGALRPAGPLLVLPPGCPISFQAPDGEQKVLDCLFDQTLFEEVVGCTAHWTEELLDVYFNIQDASIEATLRRIQREVMQPGFASTTFIEAAGNLILVDMARYLHNNARRNERAHTGSDRGLSPWQLRLLHERVAASPDCGWPSLDELAHLCRLSKNWMMRKFKVSTGVSLYSYITAAQLSVAKQLLAAGKHTAKEIAFQLGFSSPASFSVAFRRITGMTPTEFRNQEGRRSTPMIHDKLAPRYGGSVKQRLPVAVVAR